MTCTNVLINLHLTTKFLSEASISLGLFLKLMENTACRWSFQTANFLSADGWKLPLSNNQTLKFVSTQTFAILKD